MAGLKVLGIANLTREQIAESVVTLFFFGVASGGLYDLWHLIPSPFAKTFEPTDPWLVILCVAPVVACAVWFNIMHRKYGEYFGVSTVRNPAAPVLPHKGVVLVLSTPWQKSAEEIIDLIRKSPDPSDPEPLFKIIGIGQLFKGLWYHRKTLRHVWPIVTKESAPFAACIDIFLGRFIPGAQVVECPGEKRRYLVEGESQQEQIESTKALLKHIYSPEELEGRELEKSDIIVDITGGPKHMTIGLIFGALDSMIDIQYTEQKSADKQVIPLTIDHGIILDKTSDYLLELYQQINQADTPKEKNHDERAPDYPPA